MFAGVVRFAARGWIGALYLRAPLLLHPRDGLRVQLRRAVLRPLRGLRALLPPLSTLAPRGLRRNRRLPPPHLGALQPRALPVGDDRLHRRCSSSPRGRDAGWKHWGTNY